MTWWPVKLSFSKKKNRKFSVWKFCVFFVFCFFVFLFSSWFCQTHTQSRRHLQHLRRSCLPFGNVFYFKFSPFDIVSLNRRRRRGNWLLLCISIHTTWKIRIEYQLVNRQIWQEENKKKPVGDILKQTNKKKKKKKKKKNGVLFYFKFFVFSNKTQHTHVPSATNKETI